MLDPKALEAAEKWITSMFHDPDEAQRRAIHHQTSAAVTAYLRAAGFEVERATFGDAPALQHFTKSKSKRQRRERLVSPWQDQT
jgi:hypothetical protein